MEQTKDKPAEKAAQQEGAPPREAMSLQEKFVKLREAVPSIKKQQHSDGVKYTFAKIFDVYQLLTPAMNTYGVNFDVVAERASRHAENGDDLYFTSYQQQTRNGARTVWVYEADLTLRWTNADDPEDVEEVTLHALGTNDGGPDKAKGSAWTYCIKYYLFEKFGIDQGEDDPDGADHRGDAGQGQQAPQRGQSSQTQQQSAGRPPQQSQSSGGGNTPPRQGQRSGAQKGLTDAQLTRLYRKGEDAGLSKEQIDARIAEKYGQPDPHNLTRAQYDEICDALDAAKQ